MSERYSGLPQTSDSSKWDQEYRRGGIPSSVRDGPSGSVVDFLTFARNSGIEGGEAIDVGCGSGRNSIYLARSGFTVTAIDYVQSQTDRLAAAVAGERGLSVRAIHHDVRHPWPVLPASQSLAVDAFCFKHQIAREDLDSYVANAAAAIAPGGLLMLSFAGRGDGYYSRFATGGQDGLGVIILDPGNGILSRLYDPLEVTGIFEPFEALETITKHARNEMHGKSFDRETHILYLQRR